MPKKYRYYPSFGRGRRNAYAGAVGGLFHAHTKIYKKTLDDPLKISPSKYAIKWHTTHEMVRNALRSLRSNEGRSTALIEHVGRCRYIPTDAGRHALLFTLPQLFDPDELLVEGMTPELAAVKTTVASLKYPGKRAKVWGVSIRQWYRLEKRLQVSPIKAVVDDFISGDWCQPESVTEVTHTQYEEVVREKKDRPSTTHAHTTREQGPVSIETERSKKYEVTPGHGFCSCETCMNAVQRKNGHVQALQLTPDAESHLEAL